MANQGFQREIRLNSFHSLYHILETRLVTYLFTINYLSSLRENLIKMPGENVSDEANELRKSKLMKSFVYSM